MAFEKACDDERNEYASADKRFGDLLPGESSGKEQADNGLSDDALMRVALARDLLLAERLLPRDPDAAALLLDGAPRRIVVSWLALRGAPYAPGDDLLAQVERVAPSVAWRLRLALRAPHAEARLAHCWALLRAALTTTTPRRAFATPATLSEGAPWQIIA